MLRLRSHQLAEIFAHARAEAPAECCGLIGGADPDRADTLYRLHNVAPNALITYEAAPEDLFAAQRQMRERGEQLLAIYHSHPRALEPLPSDTDVRLAYYPSAVYLIVGLGDAAPIMRAFRISESERRWESVEYQIVDE